MTVLERLRARWKIIAGAGIAIVAAIWLGWLPAPDPGSVDVPPWMVVALIGLGGTAGLGIIAGKLVFEAPEPDWNYIIETNSDDPTTPKVHSLTDASLERLRVVGTKRLGRPDQTDRVYTCRYYNGNPEAPIAHTTWAGLPRDSDLLGMKPSAIEEEVAALREEYEDTHGGYQWVLDHLYMVVRRLDHARSESQNAILDDHLVPSMTDRSISDVVDDQIPDELQPDRVGLEDDPGDELDEDEGPIDEPDDAVDRLVEAVSGAGEQAATDGGTEADDG